MIADVRVLVAKRSAWVMVGFCTQMGTGAFRAGHEGYDRRSIDQLSEFELQQRTAARQALTYPAVSIDGHQALSIAHGFAEKSNKSNYTIWACSILPEHTHLVVARHTYKVEQIANLLKGASTSQIIEDGRHPLSAYAKPGERPPPCGPPANGRSISIARK